MFKGTYRHRLDGKGRLPVPAALRRTLPAGKALVLTSLDQCVGVYPAAEWQKLEAQLARLPAFDPKARALIRLLLSRAVDAELDVQGRVLVPQELRASTLLETDVVIVGTLNRFELWAPERWEAFLRESEGLLDDPTLQLDWPPAPSTGKP